MRVLHFKWMTWFRGILKFNDCLRTRRKDINAIVSRSPSTVYLSGTFEGLRMRRHSGFWWPCVDVIDRLLTYWSVIHDPIAFICICVLSDRRPLRWAVKRTSWNLFVRIIACQGCANVRAFALACGSDPSTSQSHSLLYTCAGSVCRGLWTV